MKLFWNVAGNDASSHGGVGSYQEFFLLGAIGKAYRVSEQQIDLYEIIEGSTEGVFALRITQAEVDAALEAAGEATCVKASANDRASVTVWADGNVTLSIGPDYETKIFHVLLEGGLDGSIIGHSTTYGPAGGGALPELMDDSCRWARIVSATARFRELVGEWNTCKRILQIVALAALFFVVLLATPNSTINAQGINTHSYLGHISIRQTATGLVITWDAMEGVPSYTVDIHNAAPFSWEILWCGGDSKTRVTVPASVYAGLSTIMVVVAGGVDPQEVLEYRTYWNVVEYVEPTRGGIGVGDYLDSFLLVRSVRLSAYPKIR